MNKHESIRTRPTLLARMKDLGDDGSWREFFEIYHNLIHGYVINQGLPEQDAEDIVMEIVEGVARGMPQYVYDPQGLAKFKTWLFRIVKNCIADHWRSRKLRMGHLEQVPDGMEVLEETADPASLVPDQKWEEEWEANLLQVAWEVVSQQTSPRKLQMFLYSQEHSVAKTAAQLVVTVEEVSQAKFRITEKLRMEVERLRQKEGGR